ncbi:MAG: RNA methyltransferase [Bacteroidetes bacterium]|nr:RNA methyltransferase [Bacteroidota bacterium]MDA1120746.1 RNA methyltransferase [Bacteroidota bacterium]
MPTPSKRECIEYFGQFLTDRRKSIIEKVLTDRTRHITVVLEDIYKPQNASAVVRTCECQGIQDVHIIENKHKYEVNKDVVKGASKWLTFFQYSDTENNTGQCFKRLKKDGYKILAVDPKPGSISLEELGIENKLALVFGTEYKGLSDYARDNADEIVNIPMYGFTESFNLSVSVANCLQTLGNKLRSSNINYKLTAQEIENLKFEWYKSHLRNADKLLVKMSQELSPLHEKNN